MSPAEWLHKIADLNVYRARHGVAPHKPLLLLVLCDLADEGLLPGSEPSDDFGEARENLLPEPAEELRPPGPLSPECGGAL